MVTPAAWRAPKAGAQPVSLSCQPCLQPSTVVELKTNQQPRLTKALLDQHEKAALTSLMLMQHHCLADKVDTVLSGSCLIMSTSSFEEGVPIAIRSFLEALCCHASAARKDHGREDLL